MKTYLYAALALTALGPAATGQCWSDRFLESSAGGVGRTGIGSSVAALSAGSVVELHALVHDPAGVQHLVWDGASLTEQPPPSSGVLAEPLRVVDLGGGPQVFAGLRIPGQPDLYGIARWTGSEWVLFADAALDGAPFAMEVFDAGSGPELHVAGSFASAFSSPVNGIARWDGSQWIAIDTGLDPSNGWFAGKALAAVVEGGKPFLYVGGSFAGASGVVAPALARWDGAGWSAVNGARPSPFMFVSALEVFGGDKGPALFVAGFSAEGGHAIESWNGSSWERSGDMFAPQLLTVHDDGCGAKLYAVGSREGTPVAESVLWRLDGTGWRSVAFASKGSTQDMVSFDDGSGRGLYFAGDFRRGNRSSAQHALDRWAQGDCDLATSVLCPGLPHSGGAAGRLEVLGASEPGSTLTVCALDLPVQRPGYLLASRAPGGVVPPGSQGLMCLSGEIARYLDQAASSGSVGRITTVVDTMAIPFAAPMSPVIGDTLYLQAWFRDVNPQPTSNFTEAVELTFR